MRVPTTPEAMDDDRTFHARPNMKDLLSSAATLLIFLCGLATPREALALTVVETVAIVRPATVAISHKASGGEPQPTGSGITISASGYVLTASHAVPKQEAGSILLGRRQSTAGPQEELDLVARDPIFDVALLKFRNSALSYPAIPVSSPWSLRIGETLLKAGFPLAQEFDVKMGIVSGLGGPSGSVSTDMLLNPGDSGAPVVNDNGHLVALVISDLLDGKGISFLLPVGHVPTLLSIANVQLSDTSRRSRTYAVQGSIYGTFDAHDRWANTFNASRSDGNCNASFDDIQQYCAPDGYLLENPGQLVVRSANCNSSVDSPTIVSARCVQVRAHLGGCGTDNVLGFVNCRGRGWFDYGLTLSAFRARQANLTSFPFDEESATADKRSFAFVHPQTAERLPGRQWSYRVQVLVKEGGRTVTTLNASNDEPMSSELVTRMDDGKLSIRVLE